MRLLRTLFVSIGVFAAGVGLTVAGARAYGGVSPIAAIFSYPDGAPCEVPCLLGVQPDTSFEDALDILDRHPLTAGFQRDHFANRLVIVAGPGITITLNDSSVGLMMDVYFSPPRTIGELISVIGAPETTRLSGGLKTSARDYFVYLFYGAQRFVIEVRSGGERLALDRAFRVLRLARAGFYLSGADTPWRGFATWRRYD